MIFDGYIEVCLCILLKKFRTDKFSLWRIAPQRSCPTERDGAEALTLTTATAAATAFTFTTTAVAENLQFVHEAHLLS